jgi:hypothetical protein
MPRRKSINHRVVLTDFSRRRWAASSAYLRPSFPVFSFRRLRGRQNKGVLSETPFLALVTWFLVLVPNWDPRILKISLESLSWYQRAGPL